MREDQLGWEARAGRIAAGAALFSALAQLGAGIWASSLVVERTQAGRLVAVSAQPGEFLGIAVLRGLGLAVLALVFGYLFMAARARLPNLPRGLGAVVVAGPLAFGAVSIASQVIVEADVAREFIRSGPRTDERAQQLLSEGSAVVNSLGLAATFVFVLSVIVVSLLGRRAGLLSRFMSLFGVVSAVILPFPVAGLVAIPFFWLGALAALLAGRWPGGRGPAWQVVEPIPWPRMTEQREEIERRRAEREDEASSVDPDTPRRRG